MTRHLLRILGALPVLLGLALTWGCQVHPWPLWPPSEPEVVAGSGPIVLITVEALPWSVFERGWTPSLERLARRGQARPAISTSSYLVPALGSLHTGRNLALETALEAESGTEAATLLATSPTLAELLSERGWATHAFVSGPEVVQGSGLERGYEIFEGSSRWARAIESLEAAEQNTFYWLHLTRPRPPWRRLAERTAGVRVFGNSEIENADSESKLLDDALRLYELAVRSMDQQVGAIVEALDGRDVRAKSASRIVVVGAQGISLPGISPAPERSRYGTGQDLARHQIEVPVVAGFQVEWPDQPRHLAVLELGATLLRAAGIEPGPVALAGEDSVVFTRIELEPGLVETSIFDRRSSVRSWKRRDGTGSSSFERLERWDVTETVELLERPFDALPVPISRARAPLPEEIDAREAELAMER